MYLIVGAGGFLGSYLTDALCKKGEKVIAAARNIFAIPEKENVFPFSLNVTNEDDIKALAAYLKGESVCVFYLAACHNIDFVFEHPEEAYNVNVTALKNFLYSGINISKLFFSSTDCVYGENTKDFPKLKETDKGTPVNVYGIQKTLAEKEVLSKGFTAVRLPFMTGPSKAVGKKHFYDNICASLSSGQTVEMVDGLYRSALSYEKVADILIRLSKKDDLPNVINVCADKGYTKAEVCHIIAKKNGLDESLIKHLSEKEGEKFFKDKRASSTIMDNSLLKEILCEKEFLFEA